MHDCKGERGSDAPPSWQPVMTSRAANCSDCHPPRKGDLASTMGRKKGGARGVREMAGRANGDYYGYPMYLTCLFS